MVRWDIAAMDQLPNYMKICFFVLHNSINEMAFDALRYQDVNVIQHLKKLVSTYNELIFLIMNKIKAVLI